MTVVITWPIWVTGLMILNMMRKRGQRLKAEDLRREARATVVHFNTPHGSQRHEYVI